MSKYNTRAIAGRLQNYALLLEAQLAKASFMAELTQTDAAHDQRKSIENELQDVREMAAHLWDIKESI